MSTYLILLAFNDNRGKKITGIYGPGVTDLDRIYSIAKRYFDNFQDPELDAHLAIVKTDKPRDMTVAPISEGYGPFHSVPSLPESELVSLKEMIPLISMKKARELIDRKQLAGTVLCQG